MLLQITKLCVLSARLFHFEAGSEPCATLPPPCLNYWATEWACLAAPQDAAPITPGVEYVFEKPGTYIMQLQARYDSEGNSWQGVLRTDTFLIGPPPDFYKDLYHICNGAQFLPLPGTHPDEGQAWDTVVGRRAEYAAITSNEFCSTVETFVVEPADCTPDDLDGAPAEVYLPNAFSPNGDGVNDLYEVHAPGCKLLSFHVFDRWGGLVSENYPWDGSGADAGAYVAKVALINGGFIYTYTTSIILAK